MRYLTASALTLSFIQLFSVLASIFAFYRYDLTLSNSILIVIGYFLYSGIGISLMMHRYLTHKSFEFKYAWIETLFTYIAVLSGRGSPIGWVYVHRLHHAYSDTTNDPHDPTTVGWRIFFPHLIHYGKTINKKIIKDLFTRKHLNINKYYLAFILAWSALLLSINIELFLFFYAVPIMLTFVALDLFVFLTHKYGYQNFKARDNSKNNWFISLILWGEGWHNNHHHNAGSRTTKIKWWEFDPLSIIIRMVAK